MELNEVVRRIFGEHWRLIVFFVSLGIGVAAGLHLTDARVYTASARVVLDTEDPASRAESTAIADTARAIATSPGQLSEVVEAAHIEGRDVESMARNDVSVSALGSSGVLELSVQDRDPNAAAALANTLAARVIRARLAVTQGQVEDVLNNLGRQIDDLTKKIAAADAAIDALTLQTATTPDPERANLLRSQRDEAARNRDFIVQQRSVLESERVGLLSSEALRPKPSIISRAVVPRHSDPSRLPSDLALGALLGLVLGIGIAGLLEAFRPTVVGGDALAKEFGAPLLGALPNAPDNGEIGDPAAIAARVGVAARAAELEKVALLSVGPKVNVEPLARRLQAASPQSDSAVTNGAAVGIGAFEPDAAVWNGNRGGLVLVVPSTVKRSEIAEAGHLLSMSRLPLLGLITYGRMRSPRTRRAAHEYPA
jgi:capsular polysaccharide biosynthesis protein